MESKRSPVLWNEPNKLCRPSSLARAMYPVDVAKRRSGRHPHGDGDSTAPLQFNSEFFPPPKKKYRNTKKDVYVCILWKKSFFQVLS